jgi:hypothetical protein
VERIAIGIAVEEATRSYIGAQQIIGWYVAEDQDLRVVIADTRLLAGKALREIATLLDAP